jgi:hypothetical protein
MAVVTKAVLVSTRAALVKCTALLAMGVLVEYLLWLYLLWPGGVPLVPLEQIEHERVAVHL